MRRLALVLVLFAMPIGCAGSQPKPKLTHDQKVSRQHLETNRKQAQAGDWLALAKYVDSLAATLTDDAKKAEYGEGMDWAALAAEAEAMLDEHEPTPSLDEKGNISWLTGSRVSLLVATSRGAEAIAIAEALYEQTENAATVGFLIGTHTVAGIPMADPSGFCSSHRNKFEMDRDVYYYLEACAALTPADTLAASVPWASEADLEIHARFKASIEEREREIEMLNRMDEQQAAADAAASGGSDPSSSGGASSVSVTVRNTCPETVDVFYGEKPKFGSGKYSSLGPNSRENMSFRPGDMMWIVDESQNGIASATVSASTQTIEVTSSCTGLISK